MSVTTRASRPRERSQTRRSIDGCGVARFMWVLTGECMAIACCELPNFISLRAVRKINFPLKTSS